MSKIFKVIFLILIFTVNATAEDDLKKLVLEDCNKALSKLLLAKQEEKIELIPYLAKVLKIQLGVSRDLPVASVSPGLPIQGGLPGQGGPGFSPGVLPVDGLRSDNFWRIFDPTKEVDAKACALKLLRELKPYSLNVIAEVVRFSEDDSNDWELRDTASEIVWEIVFAAKNTLAYQVEPEVMSSLLQQIGKEHSSYLAANILLEFHKDSWPILIEQVPSGDPIKRQVVFDLLSYMVNLVPDISELYVILQYADEDLKNKIINLIFLALRTKPEAFNVMLSNFSSFSGHTKEVFFKNLQKIFSLENSEISLVLSEQEFVYLFKEVFKQAAIASEVADNLFMGLIRIKPENVIYLSKIFPTGEAFLDSKIVQYLGYYPNSNPEIKKILFGEIYSSSFERQMLSMFSLGQQSYDSEEKLSAFLKVLKRVFLQKDIYQKEQIVLTVAQSILRFPVNSLSIERLKPYFIEALSFVGVSGKERIVGSLSFEQALISALNFFGTEIVPEVLKNIKKENNNVAKIRSLKFLKKYLLANFQASRSLVPLLNDSSVEVRVAARDALSSSDISRIVKDIKKAALNFNPEGRNAAWETLLDLGANDPQVQKNYRDLFKSESCENKLKLVSQLIRNDIQNKSDLQLEVLDCVLRKKLSADSDFVALDELSPISDSARARILLELKEEKLDQSFVFGVLKHSQHLGFNEQDVSSYWKLVFEKGDTLLKKEALDYLINQAVVSEVVLEVVKDSFDNSKEDFIVRTKAALYLLNFSPEKDDYRKYFKKELSREKYQWVLNAISEFKLSEGTNLIKEALIDCSLERKASILQTIGNYGEKANSATEIILYYIEDNNELLSFQATMALLKVNPLDNAVDVELRKQMRGRYAFQMLQEKNIPLAAKPILERIKADAHTVIEVEMSSNLLKKIVEQ